MSTTWAGTLPDEADVRRVVSAALAASGRKAKSAQAAASTTTIRRMDRLPGGAHIVRFDTYPHARNSFYIGLLAHAVFYLTESPDSFNAMIRASGIPGVVPDDALAIARAYLETTRPMRRFGQVLSDVADVRWAPVRTDEERRRLDAAVEAVSAVVAPPAVDLHDRGFAITAYVLYDATIERRVLLVGHDGHVDEISRSPVASGLPVPMSR
ncbi:hypothetical protein [Actinoallomurus iriomotensis]|uniref:Uncharacterized protein n=1 Tax=Actinoallomurus iriomotensis TaxID=478107 RepID=A0A9W6RTT4_9ACTN|nr:hypothetical protein [Actinoallomurus iriomotensis]GLY81618.1 hypothetical protein Airi01_098850 [Actinoallomurus iriomotensis]